MNPLDSINRSLAGRVLAVLVKGASHLPLIGLRDCTLEEQAGRVFLCGIGISSLPSSLDFAAGLRRCIAWDAVESYFVLNSLEEYTQRVQSATPMMGGGDFLPGEDTPGLPAEPSGIPVDEDTPLEAGSSVLAEWQGAWWRAEVVEVRRDGKVKIHYVGWDSTWDAIVPRSSLQVDLSDSMED